MAAIRRIASSRVSVYTRPLLSGDIFYARYKITNRSVADGQRYVTESLKTTDEEIALDRARQRYAEICFLEASNRAIRSGTVEAEIGAFVKQYEDGVAKGLRGYSKHMLVGFRKSIVRYFIEYLGKRPIQDVSADDLKGYESWRHDYWAKQVAVGAEVHGNVKQQPSPRTIEWEVNAFKQFLRWASEQGKYHGDALRFKFVVGNKHARSAFTEEQIVRLAKFMEGKKWLNGPGKHGHDARLTRYRRMLRAYVLFMAGTGLRPGEARNLKWRDIKYTNSGDEQEVVEVYVHSTHSKVKKTRIAVGVQMAAMALWVLHADRRAAGESSGEDDYLWCDADGSVIADFREGFNALIKAAGVGTDAIGQKLAVYSLRHYYISSRIRNGVDKYWLAKNTGTSPEMIRKFYDHVPTPDMTDELTKFRQ